VVIDCVPADQVVRDAFEFDSCVFGDAKGAEKEVGLHGVPFKVQNHRISVKPCRIPFGWLFSYLNRSKEVMRYTPKI